MFGISSGPFGLRGTIPEDVGAFKDIMIFDVQGNDVTGTLPASMKNWKNLTHFDVSQNHLSAAGLLPELPFDNLVPGHPQGHGCFPLDHPHGGKNQFSCPWPEGAERSCAKNVASHGWNFTFITDDDCVTPPTAHK